MGKIKTFKIDNEEYIARELTVSQVKQILDEEESGKGEIDFIDLIFPDRVPVAMVLASTGLTRTALDEKDFPPSVLEKILDEVEAVNPTSAGLFQRLAKIGRALAAKSTGQPAG